MIDDIISYLDELYPDARCELNFKNDYELLISIILSAQTTDKKVNQVTSLLYAKFPTSVELSNAQLEEVIEIINPLGLAKTKSINIINCCKVLVEEYAGNVPLEYKDLISLSGVGNKTAQVFLAVYCDIPTFAVDTHVRRVSNRLGIVNTFDVLKIEKELKDYFPIEKWSRLHHQLVLFGRYFCTARNPKCENCELKIKCHFKK